MISIGSHPWRRKQLTATQHEVSVHVCERWQGHRGTQYTIVQKSWEFIKENKKVEKKENTLSTKKETKKKRKNNKGQRKKERKQVLWES